jgi:hypothetical protein
MPHMRRQVAVAGAVAVSLATFVWATPAWAPNCPSCTTTSLMLPLEGIFSSASDPCVPAGELVSLAGEVHVVTRAAPGFIEQIHLNLAGVDGVGQTSGNMYIGTGSNKLTNLLRTDPCTPVQTNFTLEKTDGCASVPLPVSANLCFARDGTLLQSSSVSIGGDGT